jgi:hypothetical protein
MRGDLVKAIDGDVPRGAVGAFDRTGKVLYGYPESAGYWLQWASSRPDVPSFAGERVVEWLADHQLACGGWPTRTSRNGRGDQASSYLFDHAVLWHGLRCWARRRGSGAARQLAVEALAVTQRFIVNGELVAGLGPMSSRWSSRVGPFLLKTCARLRHATGPIAAACSRSVPALVEQSLVSPHAEAHPQLYAIEGLILMGHVTKARAALGDLCVRSGGIDGIRESTLGGPRRSDVLAQLLRAALKLGLASRGEPAWAALVDELIGRIDENGRVSFADCNDTRPTWAALFCEQALTTWEGNPLAAEELV